MPGNLLASNAFHGGTYVPKLACPPSSPAG
jgi:hypothetical protein